MHDKLLDIQKQLDDLAAEREAERIAENQKAAEELAAATAKEQARIAAGKEYERRTAEEKAKIEKDKADAYSAFLQREQEEKLDIARKNDAKQVQLAYEAQRQEELKKVQADREYLEECEKKRLQDSLLPKGQADIAPAHPLARFLQHSPR
jgi:hypothetical protein